MARPFFTVGHSDRSEVEFLDLLQAAGVECLVDVRKLRGSRAQPQFDQDRLAAALATRRIDYRFVEELAGRRGRQAQVDDSVNGHWHHRSFHNYADWAMGEQFAAGLARLRGWGHDRTTAVMCSEAVWWRCHRRIIADHLIAAGEDVFHLGLGPSAAPARLSDGAVVGADAVVSYPAGPTPDARL